MLNIGGFCMRGISFKTKNCIDNKDFIKIFHGINLSNYRVKLNCEEFYNLDGSLIEIDEFIEYDKFCEFFNEFDFYTVFLEMFVYKTSETKKIELPIDYKGYLKSSCEMVMFIHDSVFVEIYSKNKENIKQIMKNIFDARYCDKSYITDENDSRTKFRVW